MSSLLGPPQFVLTSFFLIDHSTLRRYISMVIEMLKFWEFP